MHSELINDKEDEVIKKKKKKKTIKKHIKEISNWIENFNKR